MMRRQKREQGQPFYQFDRGDVIPKDHLLMNVFVTPRSPTCTGS
jgi:hypothetical protein